MDLGKTLVGFVIGVVLAVAATAIWSPFGAGADGGSVSQLPSPAPTGVSPPSSEPEPWVAPGEVVFESTVLVPGALTVERGFATLDYAVTSLSPLADLSSEPENEPVPIALPERWELTTTSGQAVEAVVEEGARRVRFPVAESLTDDDIASIDVVAWRLAAPLQERHVLEVQAGASATFVGGTSLIVEDVIEQTNSTIVRVEVTDPADHWDEVFAVPVDPRWRVAGRLEGGLQFIWDGSGAPVTIELVQETPAWVPMPGRATAWSAP